MTRGQATAAICAAILATGGALYWQAMPEKEKPAGYRTAQTVCMMRAENPRNMGFAHSTEKGLALYAHCMKTKGF